MEDKKISDKLSKNRSVVINLLADILSNLLNNEFVDEKDKNFLNSMGKKIYEKEYIKFNSSEYKKIKQEYEDYKASINLGSESNKRNKLISHLKTIYTHYDILNNPKALDEALKNIEEHFKNKTNEKIKNLDKNIEKNLNRSREMLGEQAGNTNAAKYKDYAEKNRRAARWLFWTSIVIMVLVASIAIDLLWNIEEIETTKLWLRIPLGFLILLPAFFMMREAKKLKDKEFQYTDMAYRIVTSEPYIDGLNLSPEEKAKLKAALVKDFFGRPIECRDDGGLPPIDNICEVIKTCLDSCRKD